jgi:hypothetical protein
MDPDMEFVTSALKCWGGKISGLVMITPGKLNRANYLGVCSPGQITPVFWGDFGTFLGDLRRFGPNLFCCRN